MFFAPAPVEALARYLESHAVSLVEISEQYALHFRVLRRLTSMEVAIMIVLRPEMNQERILL